MNGDAGDRVVKWEDKHAGSVGLYDGSLQIEHFDSIEDLELWVRESERITRGERAALEAFRGQGRPDEAKLRAYANRLADRFRQSGVDPDRLLVAGTLMRLPEAVAGPALEALERIAPTQGPPDDDENGEWCPRCGCDRQQVGPGMWVCGNQSCPSNCTSNLRAKEAQ